MPCLRHRPNCLIAIALRFAMIGIALTGLSGCRPSDKKLNGTPADAPESNELIGTELRISGSSTIAPLILEIAQRFEQQHPGITVDVQTGGSGKGIADVRTGISEIGMASRTLKGDEQDLVATTIARDGVGFIVHSSNVITELSDKQIVDIYQDRIGNWKELGGADLPIVVVHKAEGRATLEVFLEHFKIGNPTVQADVIVGENEHAIKTVSGSVGAIGYVSIGTAEADIARGESIRLLPLDGVAASTENLANGSYPMSRPLNLVTPAKTSKLVAEFVAYCQSADVHDLIRAQFFVPLPP